MPHEIYKYCPNCGAIMDEKDVLNAENKKME